MSVQTYAVSRFNAQTGKVVMEACAQADAKPAVESIDIARIRLSAGTRTVAVLGEFRAADRLLVSWVRQARGEYKFDVEVTFLDGFVFCGCYEYRNFGRGRPSVSEFVRRTLQLLSTQQPGRALDLSRYAIESW